MSDGPDFSLLRIDHVGVAVPDLDAAIALHTGLFGLELVHREENPGQGVAEAMLATTEGTGQLQLLAPLAAETVIDKFLQRRGPGLHHVAYRVADVEAAASELRRRGIRLLYDAARTGTSDSRINFIHPADTGGLLIELVESGLPEFGVDHGRSGGTSTGGDGRVPDERTTS